MAILDQSTIEQLKVYMANLRRPIRLVASLDEGEKSREMRSLLESIAPLSDKVEAQFDGKSQRIPSFLITAEDGQSEVEFAGLPVGHEFSSLILALLHVGGHPPKEDADLLDTLSKTFGGGDENGKDMSQYVSNCERISSEFNCCVMPVHHRPKENANSQPRGHGSLRGGLDAIYLVEGNSDIRKMTISKQKDGEEGLHVSFKLKPIELGLDNEGDPVTSCVIEIVDQPAYDGNPLSKKISKLPDNQRIVWDQIPLEIASAGLPIPAEIPDDTINRNMVSKVIRSDTFSDRCLSVLRTGSDNKPDSIRRSYDRYIKALQSKGLVGVYADWLWSNVA